MYSRGSLLSIEAIHQNHFAHDNGRGHLERQQTVEEAQPTSDPAVFGVFQGKPLEKVSFYVWAVGTWGERTV
jgi:hypothetical protein